MLYPRHAVQHSEGAEVHRSLDVRVSDPVIYKGMKENVDSYSAFFDNPPALNDTGLTAMLEKERITDVYCCGSEPAHPSSLAELAMLIFRTCIPFLTNLRALQPCV